MDTLHEQPHGHGFGHMFLENDEKVGIMDIPWIFLYIQKAFPLSTGLPY